MTTRAAGFRAQVSSLLADSYVRAYMLAVAAVAVVFVLPWPDAPARRMVIAAHYPIFVAGPVVACFLNLRDVADRHERRLWVSLGISLSLWFLAVMLHAAVPERSWSLDWDVTTDILYFFYYVPLVAAGLSMAPRAPGGQGRLARWIRPALFTTAMVGWITYVVVLPAISGSGSPDWLAYVGLDLAVVGTLTGARRYIRSPRGRTLLGWLLAAFALVAAVDILEGLVVGQALALVPDSPAHVLWAIPPVVLVLAIRLRHHVSAGASEPDAGDGPAPRHPYSDTVLVLLTAFSLPVVHTAVTVLGPARWAIQPAQDLVVAVTTLLLGILVAVTCRVVELERSALAMERGELERAILQTQKMDALGRLGGGIAHDYNRLLVAIGGYSDVVIESLPESDPTARAMTHVRTAVEQASALTEQLLVFSRRQVLEPEAADVNETIRDFPHTHRHLLRQPTVLKLDLAPDVNAARVDSIQFEQVLLNLVVNARNAMPDGGTVRVATSNVELGDGAPRGWPESKAGSYVRITVADTGTGIPADVVPHVFEPFFTTKPAGSGTGLGLALVYGIVRQSGGRVSFDTTAGRGTTFDVDLPAVARRETPEPRATLRSDATGSETILLVEDEQAVRELVKSMLTMGGYHLLVAGSGVEALQVAARHQGRIDLLLTDVMMPGMNGRELSGHVARQRPDTRILFMTGYTDDAAVQHGVLDGAITLLPKPFTRHALLEIVRAVLDRPDGGTAKPGPGPGGAA